MRVIKFRGRRVDTGEWVYGSYIAPENALSGQHVILNANDPQHFVDPASVGQYTGEDSIDGVEVYEGDWLQFPNREHLLSEVKWSRSEGAWTLRYNGNTWAKIGMVALMQIVKAPV